MWWYRGCRLWQIPFEDNILHDANECDNTGANEILRLAKPAVVKPITELINKSLDTSVFPAMLKIAQVMPVHKKNSTLCKGNHRPVI
jgi:hypothetical protein